MMSLHSQQKIAMQVLSIGAFSSDAVLTTQLIDMEYEITKQPLGIPLVSKQKTCPSCSGKLSLRSDRPSRLTIYTRSLGTVPATHYHKYCCGYRKGCKFVQYYGYYRLDNGNILYDSGWLTLPYFLSSQETGFEIALLM